MSATRLFQREEHAQFFEALNEAKFLFGQFSMISGSWNEKLNTDPRLTYTGYNMK